MRRLLPDPAGDVDLDAAFWVPDPGPRHVRAVMVASADGVAQAQGRSGGLSTPTDRALFARLRSHADVLLVGASTARVERYAGERLSAQRRSWRQARGLAELPRMAVLTRSGDLDPGGPLFADAPTRPLVLTCSATPRHRRDALARVAEVIVTGEESVDLPLALAALADRGLRRVSCEGGPTLLSQLVALDQLDELTLTLSPLLLSGAALRILSGPPLAAPVRLRLAAVYEDDAALFLRYTLPPGVPG